MNAGRVAAAEVRESCIVPEKMEPVVDHAIVIMLARLIREKYEAVRKKATNFGIVDPT
jgi:hypothetical protein